MTPFDRFDRRLGDALDDLASPRFPDYFDDVLAEAVAHPQRPAWTFLERWISVSALTRRSVFVPPVPWRTVGILLMLLALLVAGAVISFGLFPDRAPAPFGPAANGRIAYAAADGDIFSRDLETGHETLLVGGPEKDVYPIFSRDGQSFFFFRLDPDESAETLMVANADGTDVRTLLGPVLTGGVAWSPSSDEIAVIVAEGDVRTLQVLPVDGGEPRVMELGAVVPHEQVEWRPPHGDELLFAGVEAGQYAIYGIRPDGTDLRQISTTGPIDSFWGPWDVTPDGSQLFYSDGASWVHVEALDLDTGQARIFGRELPDPEDWDHGQQFHGSPSITPDGQSIVFGRYWNGDDTRINHQLWISSIASDGADAVPLGPVHRSVGGHNPFFQTLAPDGESILVYENDTGQAWIVTPDGSDPEPIEFGSANDQPSWQRLAP